LHVYSEGRTLNDQQLHGRREAILGILGDGTVRRQSELTQLLRKRGFAVTQSSISRDLRELGVLKASGRYLAPPVETARASANFKALAQFVRSVRPAGAALTVVRTSTGAAQSVAVALDKAAWPEVVGTISGDDTIFIATSDGQAQRKLLVHLHDHFGI
jgi:transcriptional regulator of arginine metabolism